MPIGGPSTVWGRFGLDVARRVCSGWPPRSEFGCASPMSAPSGSRDPPYGPMGHGHTFRLLLWTVSQSPWMMRTLKLLHKKWKMPDTLLCPAPLSSSLQSRLPPPSSPPVRAGVDLPPGPPPTSPEVGVEVALSSKPVCCGPGVEGPLPSVLSLRHHIPTRSQPIRSPPPDPP